EIRESGTQRSQVMPAQRLFIARVPFTLVRKPAAGQAQERIFTPRLAEDRHSARLQNPANLRRGDSQIQMMQHGIAPDRVEADVGKWQRMSIGLHEFD